MSSFQNVKPPRVCWTPTSKGVFKMLVHQMSFDGHNNRLYITGHVWLTKAARYAKVSRTLHPLDDKFYGTEAEARLAFGRFKERLIASRKHQLNLAQAAYNAATRLKG